MFEIDPRSRAPIYEQVMERLKELMIHNVLQEDEKLPSVRDLAKQVSINPNTIQKAYRELEAQGYIYSLKGRGSFVTPTSMSENEQQQKEKKEELRKLISEALYIGVTIEEITQLIHEAKGGDTRDRSNERT
ncbi:GntR family transcriptional regulator [Pontibacillus salicampi]|uniref:GntR family transcriptional regulator n=1 Tax=Pontibacillus salicampi TaxID=1449801 RepID=A0ABV6LSI2_9BACI